MLAVSLALARLIFEPSSPTPRIAAESVLLVQRAHADLGCAPGDAGPSDAGVDAGVDAGTDAGTDAGCEPITGPAISMVLRPRFETSAFGARFALLFVTPRRPIVETVPDPFPELVALTAPRTEIHVTEIPDPALGTRCQQQGCGFAGPEPAPTFDPPDLGDAGLGDGAPAVESVGPYEIVRIQPAAPAELEAVLGSLSYRVQPADLAALAPYIAAGYTVVAVRVAVEQAGDALAPISMTWPGSELRLPLALGDQDASGLEVYIAANGRYELPGADVSFARFTTGGDTAFLTRNHLGALESDAPEHDPVAERVVGDPELQPVRVIEQTRHVPVNDCNDIDFSCCDASRGPRADFGVVVAGVALILRRRRKRATARR